MTANDIQDLDLSTSSPKKGRPGKKREREFLTQLKHSFAERRAFFFKIPDMPHFQGSGARFDIPKPFDAFGCFAGYSFVIEAKVIAYFRKFGIKDLRPCQVQGLEDWEKSGGRSYIFLLVRQQGRPGLAISPINRLYAIPWAELKACGGSISKAELIARDYMPRYRLRKDGDDAKFVQRFNVDPFLISLAFG